MAASQWPSEEVAQVGLTSTLLSHSLLSDLLTPPLVLLSDLTEDNLSNYVKLANHPNCAHHLGGLRIDDHACCVLLPALRAHSDARAEN